MQNKTIPFVDLKTQYSSIKPEIDSSLQDVIKSSRFIQGEEVGKFEKEFAKYLEASCCVGVNSGTDALILGMRALELSSGGDEVIVPANTYISSALAVSENGLKPVFADIDENDHGINLVDLKNKINNRTRAVMIVHLYGQSDKIDEIKKIINRTGKKIYLIEDACQAHGASYKGKKVGSFGAFSAFSFYPGKNLGAYGDGGALVTNNIKLDKKVRLLREYGQLKKYYHESLGVNSRLDTVQAAILLVKLRYLNKWNKKRQVIAKLYSDLLRKELSFIETPKTFPERESIYHLYVIRVNKRDQLCVFMNNRGIQSLIHYPIPLHLQKAYKYLGYKRGDLPIVERVSSKILSLPIYPELGEVDIKHIVKTIKYYYFKRT